MKIKSISLYGTRWRDVHGNTYHVVRVFVDGVCQHVSDITYGYGYAYEETAREWLKASELCSVAPISVRRWCERNGITYASHVTNVQRKRDLGF